MKKNVHAFKASKAPRHLDHGWDDDIYLVDNYIFRCLRCKVAATLIAKESIVLDLLKDKLNLEILNIEYKFTGPPEYNFLFHGYRILKGMALYKSKLSKQDRIENVYAFAYFLKKSHGIPVPEVLDAGLGPQVFNRTNKDSIASQINLRLQKPKLQSEVDCFKAQILLLFNEALTIKLNKDSQVLVHGDLYSKHLLIDNKKLTGVIDWGDVGINHCVNDLAALYRIFPKEYYQEFYGIYGNISDEVKVFAKFIF